MCGHTFDPALQKGCQACPMHKGCSLVCCPQCGFEMVDIQGSKLARIFSRLLPKSKENSINNASDLAGINPGQQAKVLGFTTTLPTDRLTYLQSYGLIPGRVVRVVQHSPVTIIQVEHTELALEREMARDIQVETL